MLTNLFSSSRRALLGIAFAWVGGLSSATPASAFSFTNGDVILTFVKAGFEVIVDAGQAPAGPTGLGFDPSALNSILPPAFIPSGGTAPTLTGADWTALAVRNPDLFNNSTSAGPVPAYNLIASTLGNASVVDYNSIGNSQAVLSPAGGATGWFQTLKQIGAVNGSTILTNTASQLVIASSLLQSYAGNVGFGTDKIGNTFPISTGAIFGPVTPGTPQTESLPLYEFIQALTEVPFGSGNFNFGVQVNSLGSIHAIPEPGTVLLVGAGLLGLARFGRRRS